jgi:Cys-tRNA(Pro)/Cys-tRNA(Cys) deacylase
MEEITPVTQSLDELNIPYRVFRHPGPITSLEQAACERGQRPNQVVRSILFRIGEEEYVMVLMAGPDQVSWIDLRHYLGQSRLTMATQEEVMKVTGYQIGGVSPIGLLNPLRILVDVSILDEEEISIGSGVRGLTVIMRTQDLLNALGEVEIGKFR